MQRGVRLRVRLRRYDIAIAEPVLFVFGIDILVQWRRSLTLRDRIDLLEAWFRFACPAKLKNYALQVSDSNSKSKIQGDTTHSH